MAYSSPAIISVLSSFFVDISHDLWPCECHGAHRESDRNDAVAVPLGRLSAVPRAHAPGLSLRLLGGQKQNGGKCEGQMRVCFPFVLQMAHSLFFLTRWCIFHAKQESTFQIWQALIWLAEFTELQRTPLFYLSVWKQICVFKLLRYTKCFWGWNSHWICQVKWHQMF